MPSTTISGTYPFFTITADFYTLTSLGTIGGGAVSTGLSITGMADTVMNGGSIAGSRYGVSAGQGLAVTNQSGGAVSGATYGVLIEGAPGTVANAGSIGGGVRLTAGGLVTNQTGGTINQSGSGANSPGAAVAVLGQTGTVDNASGITGADRGIYLGAGGTITNQASGVVLGTGLYGVEIAGTVSTVVNAGSIAGLNAGVLLLTGGTLSNLGGTITGTGGNSEGVEFGSTTGTLDNAGSIAGGQAGVFLAHGGMLTNQSGGTISQSGGAFFGYSYSGVEVQGAAGTVTNAGQISGQYNGVGLATGGTVINQAGGTIDSNSGIGVNIRSGTLVNGGEISGAQLAVQFAGGFAERLVIGSGATFAGTADGGNVIGSTAISTLELTSAASRGTLDGLGTQFIHFAQVLVDSGASWSLTGASTLASGATLTDRGTLLVNGTTVVGAGSVTVDDAGGSPASATISAGGSWTGLAQFVAGDANAGAVTVDTSGSLTAASVDLAKGTGSAGSITVIGSQSFLSGTASFTVGDSGLGDLSIRSGGTVVAGAALVVANAAGGAGSSVDVSGAGSNLQVTGLLDVGAGGSGALQIDGGAVVNAGSFDAGNIGSAVGDISVTDATFTVSGNATVADDGTGVMSVLNGATFSAANLTIGSLGASSGAVVVSGKDSVINISGALNVGTALGIGDLTIGPGAAVNAKVVNLLGQVVLEGGELDPTVTLINQGETIGGSGTIEAGDIVDEGVIQADGGKQPLVVSGTVLGGGPWTINGTAQANGGVGVLRINAGATLELNGAVLNTGSTTFTDDVTRQSTYTVANSVVDVNFADATGALLLDDIAGFAGTIAAVQTGDEFVIAGGTLSGLGVSNENTLTVSDSGNGGTDKLIFAPSVNAGEFSVVNGNTIQVACFAMGTRIAAENGCVPVERLCVGDRVVTADRCIKPIVWIGQRTVNCARHPRPETVWPVRVSAGAFGENVPERDLYLSPDHAVFVDGVLIPVRLLINGTSLARMEPERITYFHVELPRHAVILAEGLTVESYLDLGDRANFNGGETIRLFPDFAGRFAADAAVAWEARGAAPLVMAGDVLTKARMALAANLPGRSARPASRFRQSGIRSG